jgi:subtilisin family serine protease
MVNCQRFLVLMPPPPKGSTLSVDGVVTLEVERLFNSIQPAQLGISPSAVWHVVTTPLAVGSLNPWDVCHSIVQQGFGLDASAAPTFAEPDFQQQWVSGSPEDQEIALTSTCVSDPQRTGPNGYPGGENNFWYQDDKHGQYAEALSAVKIPSNRGEVVRIAHLDTGYDPTHASRPRWLETNLQRNFVDADRPNDASDDTSGLFNNRGHGTGTISILAGTPPAPLTALGIAPFVSVVPMRVANRVELFYNSAIAKAFDYVHELSGSAATPVHILSMSMGGLASKAWADAVNALYDQGVVLVTAAGNNFGNVPTRNIVYPARFNRVIAACGVMADHTPYADLPVRKMAGNYGPLSKMRTAVAGYTPNVPWAKFGCDSIVDFDGAGTSAATPQVAATAALWIQSNKTSFDAYPEGWMRVEAVRAALFTTAADSSETKLGHGELRAVEALTLAPPDQKDLRPENEDNASFPFMKVLTGLGIEGFDGGRREMLELEALQLSQSAEIEAILPDPTIDPDKLTLVQRVDLAKALANHPRASNTLRELLQMQQRPDIGPPTTGLSSVEKLHLKHAIAPAAPIPLVRRLRVYAYDPLLGRQVETIALNETVISVRWEDQLQPGPVGEYIEVIDVDPASGCCYAPINLNDSRLLATDGLRPSESNPQFHQQMAYAVAMKTIEFFEKALGRVALWSPVHVSQPSSLQGNGVPDLSPRSGPPEYVKRLRIYPHALRTANAYYSPERKALLLGYFSGTTSDKNAPSEPVFTALSHDIIAHETTHALLDGLHRRFREATNPDVLAFHEAFADIVALFQHFTLPDSLRDQVAKSRGDLSQESFLSQLAVQFGSATGHYGALRQAIGKEVNEGGKLVWKTEPPTPDDYRNFVEPHARGAVLVSAVFDAFLRIYSRRSLLPVRLATHGSEVLPVGALSTELADALTQLASKVASHVLSICIRALDYCPPVDITFGDFLRAVVTADHDLVPYDPFGYRVAFLSAFSARGIYPENVRNFSVDTVVWEPPPEPIRNLNALLPLLDLNWGLQTDREVAWKKSRENAQKFANWLLDPNNITAEELAVLGLQRHPNKNFQLKNADGQTVNCDMRGIEVHSVRPLRRVGPDGQLLSQVVVELTQSLHALDGSGLVFRGGATLIIDLVGISVAYMVRKRVDLPARVSRQQALSADRIQERADNYWGIAQENAEPFAFLHRAHRSSTKRDES